MSTNAAVGGGVPPSVVGVYQAVSEDQKVPWEILGSLGDEMTGNGTDAPDGVERGFEMTPQMEAIAEAAALRNGSDTTVTTATAEPSAEEPAGTVVPVAEPPIIDDSEGGPWLGVFLIEESAWADGASSTYGNDAQRLEAQAGVVARWLNRDLSKNDSFDPDLDLETNKQAWVEVVASLPIKGLNGSDTAEATAQRIVERAIAWSNGEDWCSATSASAGSAALPTGGPMAIGASFIYDPGLKLTDERWQNASTLIRVAFERGLGERAAVVVIAAAIPETGLMNLDYGDRDSLVPFNQSVLLYEALRDAGHDVTFYKIAGADHGVRFWTPAVMAVVIDFFDAHLKR